MISHRRARLVLLAVLGCVLAVDQLTKWWALRSLAVNEPKPLLGEVLQLRLLFNPGAAFSLARGHTWVFTIFATVVVVAVLVFAWRAVSYPPWAVAAGLVMGGAGGNLVDRLTRPPGFARGHVVDFLELPNWPVFNVADSCLCAAAALVVLLHLRGVGFDGAKVTKAGHEPEAADE